MLKTAALIFGVVFLAIGVLGFVPGVTDRHMLLGIFHVNAAHNVVHLLSGAAALYAGMTSVAAARIYFRVFCIVYGLVQCNLDFGYSEFITQGWPEND